MQRRIMAAVAALLLVTVAVAHAATDKLTQARIDAAAKAYADAESHYKAGNGSIDAVYQWSVRWYEAQRDTPLKGKALAAAADDHLARMTALQTTAQGRVVAGTAPQSETLAATYYVAEAELWSARAKGK